MPIPKYEDLLNPLLKAMHNLGGSATNEELENQVAKILNLTEQERNEIHRGNRTKLNYRLAWTRNYLKRYGLLENSAHGIWALTAQGNKISEIDSQKVYRELHSKKMIEI